MTLSRATYGNLFERLQATLTDYTECIKITRTDGVIYRLTAHDEDLRLTEPESGGTFVYRKINSFNMSALETQIGLVVSNMDVTALIDDDAITEEDLLTGKFDHAKIEVFIAYWTEADIGILPLRVSWVGEIQAGNTSFRGDLRGIAQRLAQVFIHTVSLECRWTFCDDKCGLNPASYEFNYTVTQVTNREKFTANIPGSKNNDFKWGLCTFMTGANAGLNMEIIHQPSGRIGLFLPMPYDIAVGNTVKLRIGCPKTYSACKDFGNYRRFGGEPFAVGSDALAKYPQPGD